MKDCQECTERKLGCHSTCSAYIEWKKNDEERKDRIRKNRSPDADEYRHQMMAKIYKEHGKKKVKRQKKR